MIAYDDEEFRRLFEQEARGRLDALAAAAAALEPGEPPRAALDAMFRDAHTLKGGAAVVGLEAVAERVHGLEQLLEEVRSRRRALDAGVLERVLSDVEAVRAMLAGGAPRGPGSELVRAAPAPAPAQRPAGEAIAVPVSRLDEVVRLVGESTAAQLRIGRLLDERLAGDTVTGEEYHRLARTLGELRERAMRTRMVSVATIAGPLERAAREIARSRGKEVIWELVGGETELDRHVLETLREPLVALVRNAVDHGIEAPGERRARGKPAAGTVRVRAAQVGSDVTIAVADDGRGVDLDRVRTATGRRGASDPELLAALFEPGVSTAAEVTEISGRGVGLDAVRQAVEAVRGRVEVHASVGDGTEFRITVPLTLAVLRCLLARVGGRRFALPLHATATALRAEAPGEVRAEGRPALWVGGEAVPLADLGALVGAGAAGLAGPAVVVETSRGRLALRVDALDGQRDVVVHHLGAVLPPLPLVAGASIEPDGSILAVLDPAGLVDAARTQGRGEPAGLPHAPAAEAATPRTARVLVVDDALMVRELQRSILERAGFAAETAADGREALARLAAGDIDLVVTDVEMPGMDGVELTRAIRADPRLAATPVIVLSAREGDDDRRDGLAAGADRYLVKSAFDERTLLDAIRGVLGAPPDTTPPP